MEDQNKDTQEPKKAAKKKVEKINVSTDVFIDGVRKNVVILNRERLDASCLSIEQVKELKKNWSKSSRKLTVEEEQIDKV